MALPAGFKVNGSATRNTSKLKIPPAVQKVVDLLDKLPYQDLLDSRELWIQSGVRTNNSAFSHPVVDGYRHKVDNKLMWGSPQTITELRRQLNEPEEINGEN